MERTPCQKPGRFTTGTAMNSPCMRRTWRVEYWIDRLDAFIRPRALRRDNQSLTVPHRR